MEQKSEEKKEWSLLELVTSRGSISKTDLRPTLIFHTLHQTFMPLKASQKLGVGCKLFGVGHKPVYEIDPRLQKRFQIGILGILL